MKILILANAGVGLYKFRKELLETLIKNGHEVYISLPRDEFTEDLLSLGCEFIETNISRRGTNPIADLKLLGFYKKIIKQVMPSVVFTYTIKPNVYGGMACASVSVPYVANITGLGTAVENPGLLQKITLFLYRKGLKHAKKVFFQNSENMEFMIKNKIIKDRYALLPGSGVNLSNFVVTDYPSDENVNFVFIARVMKEKGIDQYLEAAKFITKKYPHTKFHICGFCEDEYKGELDDLVNRGIVSYHGLVKDMNAIYSMASCTIHPTYYPEGLSNVLLESCASGRPIITTNRSGCREVVDDGINGYIVNQKDSDDLIKKIETFLSLTNEQKKMMGLAGRLKVEKEFDRQIVITKYLEELQ